MTKNTAPGSTEVEHSAHNPKIAGSNPSTGTVMEKLVKNLLGDYTGGAVNLPILISIWVGCQESLCGSLSSMFKV
jgi:hypothetical protein